MTISLATMTQMHAMLPAIVPTQVAPIRLLVISTLMRAVIMVVAVIYRVAQIGTHATTILTRVSMTAVANTPGDAQASMRVIMTPLQAARMDCVYIQVAQTGTHAIIRLLPDATMEAAATHQAAQNGMPVILIPM